MGRVRRGRYLDCASTSSRSRCLPAHLLRRGGRDMASPCPAGHPPDGGEVRGRAKVRGHLLFAARPSGAEKPHPHPYIIDGKHIRISGNLPQVACRRSRVAAGIRRPTMWINDGGRGCRRREATRRAPLRSRTPEEIRLMTPSTNPDELPRAAGESQRLEFRIEALERCIADLQRVVAERADIMAGPMGPCRRPSRSSPRGDRGVALNAPARKARAPPRRPGTALGEDRVSGRGARGCPSAAVPRTEGDR